MIRLPALIMMMSGGMALWAGCHSPGRGDSPDPLPPNPGPVEKQADTPREHDPPPRTKGPPIAMHQGTVSEGNADREGTVALRLSCPGPRVPAGQPLLVKVALVNRGPEIVRVPVLSPEALSFSVIGADRAAAGMSMDGGHQETCDLAPGESRECIARLTLPPRGEVRITANFGELTSNTLTLTVVEN